MKSMPGIKALRITRGCGAVLLMLYSAVASSQDTAAANYPNRPVRWIVAIAPGGSNDLIARLIAPRLADALGQQFVVDNRPGGGGSIGAETVAKANPDGHTLLFANPGPNVGNIVLKKNPTYTFADFTPVIFIGYAPLIIVANPKLAANSVGELVAFAKNNPGKLSWGSSGNGSILHIGLAALQSVTGVNVTHVPYKGAVPAMTDVMSGQIDLMYTTAIAADQYVKAGRLKIVGVASPTRQPTLPNVPTLSEHGVKDADSLVWFGIVAPAKTSPVIVGKLNGAVNAVLAGADVRRQLESMGVVIEGGRPDRFGRFISAEASQLRKLVKEGRVPLLD